MREAFKGQLDELVVRLGELAALAGEGLDLATRALFDTDLEAAQQALDLDSRIAELDTDCSERAVRILALQGPVAADLRLVFSAVRITSDLTRMGELSLHIARAVRRRHPESLVSDVLRDDLRRMADLAAQIVEVLRGAFAEFDLETISGVHAFEDELDKAHSRVLATLEGPDWDGDIPTAVDTALVARFYGRFGDQAVDVADRLIFFVTGERPAA
ncbi:phosphate signaling complex protein PhoU [Rhodococcus sp. Z13]|uniref:Phosphate signaling complex protein PhoU n=1 Tax=Rhodococcus sacchari TaxID=2962047 RepID=A0ACD4DES1_9NOCA|nr:phosphate signaling complex protein PhoU [Rhodococcus sp. Z13]UYP18506.1 phosphate signaling complex protein PhoU [Rhodococcus sp. Z13]